MVTGRRFAAVVSLLSRAFAAAAPLRAAGAGFPASAFLLALLLLALVSRTAGFAAATSSSTVDGLTPITFATCRFDISGRSFLSRAT